MFLESTVYPNSVVDACALNTSKANLILQPIWRVPETDQN